MIQGSFLIKNKSGGECIPNHKEGREQRRPDYWYSPYSFLISPRSTILSLASIPVLSDADFYLVCQRKSQLIYGGGS